VRVKGKVSGLGNIYANGLEHLEIRVNKDEGQDLPHEIGSKVPVQIIIGSRQYSGGVRSTEAHDYIWVSPTLMDSDNQRTTLAEALMREGIEKNQSVDLEVSGNQVKIIPV
jgi:hypothetical protein